MNENKNSNEQEKIKKKKKKKYKKYENKTQPRITDIKIDMELYPEERNFVANGKYILKNKSNQAIDTLFIDYAEGTKISFNTKNKLVSKDTVYNINIYRLEKSLQPGDSIQMSFVLKNKPNSLFENNSPVLSHQSDIQQIVN